jgi:hypothetical protein
VQDHQTGEEDFENAGDILDQVIQHYPCEVGDRHSDLGVKEDAHARQGVADNRVGEVCRIRHGLEEDHRWDSLASARAALGDKSNICLLEVEPSCRNDHIDHEGAEEVGEVVHIHEEDILVVHHQADRTHDRKAEGAGEVVVVDLSFYSHHSHDA